MKNLRARARSETGAAMVEMAFVLPVLLLLVLGIVNLGYLAAQAVEVNSAARQGARTAVVPHGSGTAPAKANAAVNDAVSNGTLKNPGTTVAVDSNDMTVCGSGDTVGEDMKVKVTYDNPGWLAPVPFFDIPVPDLSAEAVYVCEW